MPRLSESMEEGTILRWLRTDGDAIQVGDELAEIETDKVTRTFEAESAGVLRIVAGEGALLPVGAVIATLAEQPEPAPVEAATAAPPPPAARRRGAAPEPVVTETGTAKGDVRVLELTRGQQVVARRMAESKATVPDLALATHVDMDRCADLRVQLEQELDPAPTDDDLVVKAVALALREEPRANAAYRDGRFELYSRVNVGIAVPAQGTLAVPTLFDADRRSLAELARESRALAERARAGALTPPELGGGTFTVASLGAYGTSELSPVINPPQAAILGVGAVREAPVVRGGHVVPGRVLSLRLVCDHRILYGAEAARFLARIRALRERPAALTLPG
jgi:pyruvate dehydrogenase E2 component (dihydrolipoamide acetyltransferase)